MSSSNFAADMDDPMQVDSVGKHNREEKDERKHRSSGHHKSSSSKKDDPRSKDKDKDKEREKDKEKERDKEKKDGRDREKEKERDKDREREREKDRDRERERDREKDRNRDKNKYEDKDRRDKERERDRDRDRDRNKRQDSDKENKKKGEETFFESREGGASEISLSVEDTNKLRAQLGLPPLDVDNTDNEKTRKENEEKLKQAQEDAKSREIMEKVDRLKRKRLLNAKLPGKSIAEEQEEDREGAGGDENAGAWVQKSRQLEQEKRAREKELAEQRAKMMDDLDEENEKSAAAKYTKADLAGLKIAHAVDSFSEHDEILVLKDAPVVNRDGLNEEDDELENVMMSEMERRKKNADAAKKTPLYDVYGDSSNTQTSLLPQYDEEKKKEAVILDEHGRAVDPEKANKALEEIRKKLHAAQRKQYDLQTPSAISLATDYYTQEEMTTFRKPLKKKKKVIRKKEKTVLVELDTNMTETTDHGSRTSKSQSAIDEERTHLEDRKRNYEKALSKAEEESKALLNVVVAPSDIDEEEDLYESLSRAKRAASSQAVLPKLQAVVESVVKRRQEERDIIPPKLEDGAQDSELIFSATSEFVRHLKTEIADENMFSTEEKKAPSSIPAAKEEPKPDEENEDEENVSSMDVDNEDKHKPILPDEPLVAGGMAATLRLLAQKGGARQLDLYSGRANDKKLAIDKDDPAPHIRLEYLDSLGRPMTPKEAFRDLSYHFHGKKPGKNNQEKRMKHMQEQQRRVTASSTDTPLMTLQAMQQAQLKTGTPYIVLSSGAFTRGVPSSNATNTTAAPSSGTTQHANHEKGGFSEVTNVASSNVSSNTKVEFGLKAKSKGPLQKKLKS